MRLNLRGSSRRKGGEAMDAGETSDGFREQLGTTAFLSARAGLVGGLPHRIRGPRHHRRRPFLESHLGGKPGSDGGLLRSHLAQAGKQSAI